jgi:DNA topoisomerase-1
LLFKTTKFGYNMTARSFAKEYDLFLSHKLRYLEHNGVLVPEPPSPRHLEIWVRGELLRLTPKQEEMAVAWARKDGTPYVEDPVFIRNFLDDFSAALGVNPPLELAEVDFQPAIDIVLQERADKEALTREERKAQAAERKAQREALKEQFGYAIVNGERVELGAYIAEPSGIFMGRGEHPLRGRWKEGAAQGDITLNLSPDAPMPPGDWLERVWQPESLWVARWEDKLSGKLKYIWLSDTAPIKQTREAQKFDKAIELDAALDKVRTRIQKGLISSNPRRKMVATACYLIDTLCLRVGDEKDEDEADTVGATTLRPEHVTLYPDGTAVFNFLGKDSVEWNKTLQLPPIVAKNLAELVENAHPPATNAGNDDKPQIFPLITSRSVNRFLSSAMPGLTAKVFRTHHATEVVQTSLEEAQVEPEDPEYVKWGAVTRANLQAAELCNHTKQVAAGFPERLKRMQAREKTLQERVRQRETQLQERKLKLARLPNEAIEKFQACTTEKQRQRAEISYKKRIARAEKRVDAARRSLRKARAALGKLQTQMAVNTEKRAWNLNTSLKSYIDPRVYYRWGQKVDYDVLERYYPKTLRRKFAWARQDESADDT